MNNINLVSSNIPLGGRKFLNLMHWNINSQNILNCDIVNHTHQIPLHNKKIGVYML
jgi:hypothetical protein